MAERDYAAQPVSDTLGLRTIIDGLACDLQDLRNGRITPPEALARAALAKQIFNGVRLYIVAHGTKGNLRPDPDDPPRAIEGTAE